MNIEVSRLLEKIRAKKATIGVIGLGYVGLPLVKIFLEKGFRVTGYDIDDKKINMLNRGRTRGASVSPAGTSS